MSLGCSVRTDQYAGFKMQGKRDSESDTKCYDVITGKVFHWWSFFTKIPLSGNHVEKKYLTFF